ncbi:MAG: DUF1573 domain-containing protein [Phycisphaerales bacterium]|nr:DUF1573 domain-containing protein [Phycisphaerae bacterium]NNF42645.1 DUF1573 domain-containing protein [Phycisphaerales bacterium]NNM26732.1 DUF1573 domain-containing protein [Phycisphaerales bacterium]
MELESLLATESILTLLWQTTFWLLAGLVAATLMRRHPARSHAVLVAALLAALLTPIATFLFQRAGWGLLPAPASLSGIPEPVSPTGAAGRAARPAGGGMMLMLAGGWLLGSGLLLARLAVAAARARAMIGNATPWSDDAIAAPTRAACAALRVGVPPVVLRTPDVRSPMIWCWGRRPTILFPAAPSPAADDRLFGILCHELAHLQRRDHVTALVAEIASCVLFWHPLAWVTRRRLRQLSEQACDAWVLAAGVPAHRYADALIGLIPTSPPPRLALAAVSGRRGVVARIDRILRTPVTTPRGGRMFALAAVTVTGLGMTITALAQRRAPVPVPPLVLELSPQPPVPATPGVASSSGALTAVPGELDLGVSAPGGTVYGAIWLVNEAAAPVRILSARASCGCTTVGAFAPTDLEPGERMRVDLSMEAPKDAGVKSTKKITFTIEDHEPLQVPIFIATEPASTPAST